MKDDPSQQHDSLRHPTIPLGAWSIGGVGYWDHMMTMCLAMVNSISEPGDAKPDFTTTPPCLWTLEAFGHSPLPPFQRIQDTIALYTRECAGLFLNFDNPRLQQRDVADAYGNALFDMLVSDNANRTHGVYVANELLAKHLRQRCPNINIRLGANRLLLEKKRDATFYNMLASKYDRVSIDPRDVTDRKLLEKLRDKRKFEITVNDPGITTMEGREAFWETIGKLKREPWNMELADKSRELFNRWTGGNSPILPNGTRPLSLMPREVSTLFDMGFRHFRIQAEMLRSELSMAWALTRWLLNPDPDLAHRKTVIEYAFLGKLNTPERELPSGFGRYIFRDEAHR